jgi:hypothetical protein
MDNPEDEINYYNKLLLLIWFTFSSVLKLIKLFDFHLFYRIYIFLIATLFWF